ncbi:MAG: DUF4268 domain-containing protein [Anaerolineae bacterium]|jgi:hypothetical protein|nr:DUF4268 domain-containing protein [Anaerolineae bacterium]
MPVSTPLLKLERVPLRSIWSNEATDFTPWLSQPENLERLSDVLQISLELESTERRFGDFRADIVCRETMTGHWVIIENQLERTDHSHLGQLFTYAAGLRGQVTIVWIAERFTDEHRAALDWLNDVTNESVRLFGIEIELWRIGDSAVAPNFKIVSQPNDWTKRATQARERSLDENVSELDLLKLEFWEKFRLYVLERSTTLKPTKPSTNYWTNYAIGRSGFNLGAMAGMRDGFIGVNLNITHPHAAAFHRLLLLDKEQIEAELGFTPNWREDIEIKTRYVEIYWHDIDPTNQDNWPVCFDWLYNHLEAFYAVFAKRIKSLGQS